MATENNGIVSRLDANEPRAKTIAKGVANQALDDAALFVEEFNEPLDPAKGDWDSTAWGECVRKFDLTAQEAEELWPMFSAILTAQTERLCR